MTTTTTITYYHKMSNRITDTETYLDVCMCSLYDAHDATFCNIMDELLHSCAKYIKRYPNHRSERTQKYMSYISCYNKNQEIFCSILCIFASIYEDYLCANDSSIQSIRITSHVYNAAIYRYEKEKQRYIDACDNIDRIAEKRNQYALPLDLSQHVGYNKTHTYYDIMHDHLHHFFTSLRLMQHDLCDYGCDTYLATINDNVSAKEFAMDKLRDPSQIDVKLALSGEIKQLKKIYDNTKLFMQMIRGNTGQIQKLITTLMDELASQQQILQEYNESMQLISSYKIGTELEDPYVYDVLTFIEQVRRCSPQSSKRRFAL